MIVDTVAEADDGGTYFSPLLKIKEKQLILQHINKKKKSCLCFETEASEGKIKY